MSRDIFEVNLDIIITFHQVNMNETWEESEDGLLTGLQRLEMKGSHNMQDKVLAKAETFLGIQYFTFYRRPRFTATILTCSCLKTR